jgi:serine/threonine protein kinase
LKRYDQKGFCVEIGLIAIHEFSGKSHSLGVGTYNFMAPEVFTNKKYDTKADICSLGVIFQNLFDLETQG